MYSTLVFLTMVASAFALPDLTGRAAPINIVASFNNYAGQSSLACHGINTSLMKANNKQIYMAATGDIGPAFGHFGQCAKVAKYQCQGASSNTPGPSCSEQGGPAKALCGMCYTVTNPATKKSIKVQVVDFCPAEHPNNICKTKNDPTKYPASQTCTSPSTNQIDIDNSGYTALTGKSGTPMTVSEADVPSPCVGVDG